jgi:hypothetical protein
VSAALLLAVALSGTVPAAVPGAPVRAQGAELSVALSPEAPTVGDPVTAVLTLSVPLSRLTGEPRFPVWEGSWGAAEVVAAGLPERLTDRAGTATFRQRVTLTAFRPGPVPLPVRTLSVPLGGEPVELTTPPELAFTVASVLPPLPAAEDPASTAAPPPLEPRPPEPPRRLPVGAPFLWAAGSLALLALALAVLLGRRRPATAAAAAPVLSPLEELEQALARVYQAPTVEQGSVLLSLAVRRYLGRQLGFPAVESTTSEIRQRLRLHHLPTETAHGVTQVLSGCDLVKFARHQDPPGELTGRADRAQQLARALDRHLAPAPEPSP